jgi:hypothetical protein
MSLPLHFPVPSYSPRLQTAVVNTVRQLCELAGVACRASGAWTSRPVEIVPAEEPFIVAEPGGFGSVRVGVPKRHNKSPMHAARYALGALAYALFDGVARESIKSAEWSKIEVLGRPKTARALTSAARQRRYRAAHTSKGASKA